MALNDFKIVDSTLREGEQFLFANFERRQKVEIAKLLDQFGVAYIELTSPCASPGSFEDCHAISQLGLNARILTHIRCHMDDARKAVEAGVDGVNLVFGTSAFLRDYSHGQSIAMIIEKARRVLGYLKGHQLEIRFSSEDSLRSENQDLFRVYEAVSQLGVDRVGVADTVGVATPFQVYELVSKVRKLVDCDIEFHGHNDTGCAVANAHAAIIAGATHIDTTVLGIGERNGITPLGGLIARIHALDPRLTEQYNLPLLKELDALVARSAGVEIPFNTILTGSCAFAHKAGIHTKAVLNNPSTYEALDPYQFGLQRRLEIGHKLTGWNAVGERARVLGLSLGEGEIKAFTQRIKAIGDGGSLELAEIDTMLRAFAMEHASNRGETKHNTAENQEQSLVREVTGV